MCWMIDVTHLVMKSDVKAKHVHRGSAFKASTARLAQSAERKALNLVVVGSSPAVGAFETTNSDVQYVFRNINRDDTSSYANEIQAPKTGRQP